MEKKDLRMDPIVEEVRKARQAHAKKFSYDLDAIVRELKRHEQSENRKVVSFPAKRPEEAKGAA